MFGLRNFTGVSFVKKIGKWAFEFSAGLVEEITWNVTRPVAVNVAEIPELIPNDAFITTTSAVVGSKITQTNIFDVVGGATTNLLI